MHAHQAAVLETLSAVQTFLDEKKERLGDLNDSPPRRVLDQIVDQLTESSLAQLAGQCAGRGETARLAKLRHELRVLHMQPIAAVVKTVLPQAPTLSAFTVPYENTSSMRLIAAAGAMAEAAKTHEAVLIDAGLPHDFVEDLQAAATTLQNSLNTRTMSMGRSQGATRALKPLVRHGLAILKVLDAMLSKAFKFDEALLGAWNQVKTVRKKPGPARDTGASAGPDPETPVAPGNDQ